jgi:peptidoglycan/xylan/chitin deacetylase (PgdA/CDA1 family)
MALLSPILKRAVYPSLAAMGYLGRRRVKQISVITYHGVLPRVYQVEDCFLDDTLVTADVFRRQLRLLKSRYYVLSPQEFRDCLGDDRVLPENALLLTCDDGLLNNVTEMLPILQEEKLSSLFFVTGASIRNPYTMLWYVELYLMLGHSAQPQIQMTLGDSDVRLPLVDTKSRRSGWLQLMNELSHFDDDKRRSLLEEIREQLKLLPNWESRYLEDPVLRNRYCVMGLPELKQLVQGGMSFGAHSMSHPIPSQQPEEVLRAEMLSSREVLEKALGQPVWAFAYPFGDEGSVSEREYGVAEQLGFQCAFRNVGGPLRSRVRPSALPRIHISADMNLGEFEAHVCGFHEALRARLGR